MLLGPAVALAAETDEQTAIHKLLERYRRLKIWKSTPVIEEKPMEKFQDILVQGHVLEPGKRVKFQDLILTEFAAKAK